MNNVTDFLATTAVILAALVALGGGLALVRGAYSKARVEALREDVDDAEKRLKVCEQKLSASEAREATLEAKVQHVESENELLTALVTQKANVDEVLSLLNDHHEAAMEWMRKLTAAIVDLHDEVQGQKGTTA